MGNKLFSFCYMGTNVYLCSMGIGVKIRQLRELRGFSQEYMAEQLGIALASYGRLERGENGMSVQRLEQIAQVLEIPADELLKFDAHSVVFHSSNNQNCNNHLFLNNPVFNAALTIGERELYENEIEHLKTELANLKKIIELLETQLKER